MSSTLTPFFRFWLVIKYFRVGTSKCDGSHWETLKHSFINGAERDSGGPEEDSVTSELTSDVAAVTGLTSSCAWTSSHNKETMRRTEGAWAGLPIKTPLYSIIALQASFVQLSPPQPVPPSLSLLRGQQKHKNSLSPSPRSEKQRLSLRSC